MSETVEELVHGPLPAWRQVPGKCICPPCIRVSEHIAELERHQAEANAAIRALENAGRVLGERLDEFEAALIGQRPGRVDADPDIFFFQETPESWEKMHALDSAQVDLDTAIQEHAAALQRAREQEGK